MTPCRTADNKAWSATPDGCLVVTVADDGPGIRARSPEVVFQPGYTTKVDRVTGRCSAGLGLPHVRDLVQELGGEVQVERTGADGTLFRIAVPLERVAPFPPGHRASTGGTRAGTTGH